MTRGTIHARVSTSDGRQEVDNQKAEMRRPAGRPRLNLDGARVVALRDGAQLSWRAIAKQLRAGATTVRRAYRDAERSGGAAERNPETSCSTAERSTEEESA
jgi:DNA invertase Pin-like site-specific DNA recombinase